MKKYVDFDIQALTRPSVSHLLGIRVFAKQNIMQGIFFLVVVYLSASQVVCS